MVEYVFGILRSTIAVDYSAFQCRINCQGVFQCLDTQICFPSLASTDHPISWLPLEPGTSMDGLCS